jgi:hypothetical protein
MQLAIYVLADLTAGLNCSNYLNKGVARLGPADFGCTWRAYDRVKGLTGRSKLSVTESGTHSARASVGACREVIAVYSSNCRVR